MNKNCNVMYWSRLSGGHGSKRLYKDNTDCLETRKLA